MRIKYCVAFRQEILDQPSTVALSMGARGYAYSHNTEDIKILFKLSKFISPNVRNEKTFVSGACSGNANYS